MDKGAFYNESIESILLFNQMLAQKHRDLFHFVMGPPFCGRL